MSSLIEKVGQVAIPVRDIDRAVAFYRDVLGLDFLFQVPNLAFFNCGGLRLMLALPEGPVHADSESPGSDSVNPSVMYYKVADIHAAFSVLKDRGARIIDAPHEIAKMEDHDLWMFFVRDGEGNMVGLMCELQRTR